jgi:hypothetical protein
MGLSIDKMIDYLGDDWEKVDNDKLYDDLFLKTLDKINGKTKEIDPKGIATAEKEPEKSGRTEKAGKGNKRGPKKLICGRSGTETINTSSGDRQPVQPEEATDQSERPETEDQG